VIVFECQYQSQLWVKVTLSSQDMFLNRSCAKKPYEIMYSNKSIVAKHKFVRNTDDINELIIDLINIWYITAETMKKVYRSSKYMHRMKNTVEGYV